VKELSKLMSLMLRHEPSRFGLELDPEGFVALDAVLAAVRTRFPGTHLEDIRRVVETVEPAKQRFTIVDEDIRANYGHSLAQRVTQEAAFPPEVLFHGTHRAAVDAILADGLRPMKRQYVHLTDDLVLARQVGGRRGAPHVLQVAAARAAGEGVRFYRANPTFWLADFVPARYVRAG
jgi:putative RNA 2'-phosphotransferase